MIPRRIVRVSMAGESLQKSITVVGAGGNIGSHLTPHLARMPGVGRVTLVDFDVYEEKNLVAQDILPADVGRPKAVVQARRMRAIRPGLDVRPIAQHVERVPRGLLRSDVIIASVDSRIARQSINEIAWRLGCPWIDSGVLGGSELLARVNVYIPGVDSPCLECAWDQNDYAQLEIRHPCQAEATIAATNAPSMLGALSASLAAIECRKLLDGDLDHALAGRQVVLDALHHTHFVTSFRRNRKCLFDHRTWEIQPAGKSARALRLLDLPELASTYLEGCEAEYVSIGLAGERFLLKPFCAKGCTLENRRSPEVLGLAGRLPKKWTRCPKCNEPLTPRGWDLADTLPLGTISATTRRRTLASLGFEEGDIFALTTPAGDAHLMLSL